jgi:Na+/H+-dicarboxylate symporter
MTTNRLTRNILVALIIGLATGYAVNRLATPDQAKQAAYFFGIITNVFLRLIKMIIAPLVLSTLVVGIAHMGSGGAVGRTFVRTLAWFIAASIVSLSLGIFMVNMLQPGVGVGLALPAADAASGVTAQAFDLAKFIEHIVPKSIFDAMATNEVLQIVVFSLFAGTALIAIGDTGKPIIVGLEALMHLMLKITGYVMNVAPAAVFAAIASAIAVEGLGILIVFGKFIGGFYLALLVLWIVLLGAGAAVIGVPAIRRLIPAIREPFLITFATASSEAAYPKLLESL